MTEPEPCKSEDCRMQARVAIRTQRVDRDDLKHTLHMDNRTAPKTATRYCVTHARVIMEGLVDMADRDELMPGVPGGAQN